MKKFVIMALRHTGKTTLANMVLEKTDRKVCGFSTQKHGELIKEGLCPVFIAPIGKESVLDDEHCVGLCNCGQHYTNYEVFNTLGVEYLTCEDKDTIIVMDEVGFLEMNAERFKAKIFEVLQSENPVLLMLKERMDIDYLKEIRDYPGVEFIHMTEENREEVFERVLSEFC